MKRELPEWACHDGYSYGYSQSFGDDFGYDYGYGYGYGYDYGDGEGRGSSTEEPEILGDLELFVLEVRSWALTSTSGR